MPITRVEDLPEYTEANVNYQIALRDAADNEASKLQAQLAWSETQRKLDKLMVERNEHERSINEVKAKIAANYVGVPEHIYASYPDAASMEAAAKAFFDAVTAATSAGAPPQPVGAAGGQPPTGAGQGSDTPPVNPTAAKILKLREEYEAATDNAYRRKELAVGKGGFLDVGLGEIVVPQMRNAMRAQEGK